MSGTEPSEVETMIAEYRRTHGLTLQQLGELLGVQWGTVWRWENGKRTPPGRLVQLALRGLDAERLEQVPTS